MNYTPNRSIRRKPIVAVVYHWTGGTFKSAVDWCLRDESDVSYHTIISPTGERRDLIPFDEWKTTAAWSVGHAKTPPGFPESLALANHVTINIALAGGPPVAPTQAAVNMAVAVGHEVFLSMKWGTKDLWRVLGHADVAVYGPDHPKAGQFGRKPDPWGNDWLKRANLVAELERLLKLSGV
jgi:hypothetical protein